jgi:hypothetical protein
MTGPAQRGYVASSSTELDQYIAHKAFNGNPSTGSGNSSDCWVSADNPASFTNGLANSNYGFDFGQQHLNELMAMLDKEDSSYRL